MAQSMIQQSKISNQFDEIDAVHKSRPTQILKTKKPEQLLLEVRNRKISEMNTYKDAPSEKKYKDIQNLLKEMNTHGKLPKKDQIKIPGVDDPNAAKPDP